MRNFTILLLALICLNSCKSSKKAKSSHKTTTKTEKRATNTTNPTSNALAESIVDYAKQFDGVRYKYGGTTKKGMDCSGLVMTAFKSENIMLPRTTSDLSVTGNWIDLKEVQKGDLMFFATRKNSRKVNHVGIVTFASEGNVEFIHASTSAGVIISSLAERYWYFAFVQARRVL
ncbi:C40 family peptidase [Gaetbulibacter jejuensis]|uniref:NlpC/P60 domain-containing protein n=1 Tax=Gaetbulibacter jejuensis TaxID=584607 RepID=A0ABN1JGM0_9FLAO